MKVEISESGGGADITCYCGSEKVKVAHKELKTDSEGKPVDEIDLMVALLNAASEAVGSIPRLEEVPEGGESKAERLEREEKNRKTLDEWRTERERIEAEEEETMLKTAADAQAAAAPQQEPQEEPELQENQPQQVEPQPA